MNLVQSGEVSAKQVKDLLEKKKTSLLNKIKIDDIEKGDILILKNGAKAVVFGVNKNDVKAKVFGSPKGEYISIKPSEFKSMIQDIKQGKVSDSASALDDEVDMTPTDQKEVEASKDNLADYKKDAGKIKQNAEESAKKAGTDNKSNLDDLLNNIGCKPGA
jgi:hypothetical protein